MFFAQQGGFRRRPQPDPAAQLEGMRSKLCQVESILKESEEIDDKQTLPDGTTVEGPTDRVVVRLPNDRGEVVVVVGTSKHAEEDGLPEKISRIVDDAYSGVGKGKHVSRYDAVHRLEMGDAGVRANRVLHLAYKGEALVGCCSSTFDPGWTPEDCGHWGLLAVAPAHQNSGIAKALVLAAERRLATVSEMVQIEYSFNADAFSHRITRWYEDKLGFSDGNPTPSHCCFRSMWKHIPEQEQRRGRHRRLKELRDSLRSSIDALEALVKQSEEGRAEPEGKDEQVAKTEDATFERVESEGEDEQVAKKDDVRLYASESDSSEADMESHPL